MTDAEEQAAQMYPESDITYGVYTVREAFVAGYKAAKSDASWERELERSYPQDTGRDGWL